MRLRSKRRGVFFISVLFIVVMISMFVGAAFELGVFGLKRAASQADVAAAQRAARSGIEYALARLKVNPAWKADSAKTAVVDTPELLVVEERGNVVGIIRDQQQFSQFRIRFNYYDDSAGNADGMADPGGSMTFADRWVSVNNLASIGQSSVPETSGSSASVSATPASYTNVPSRAVFLSVEGRAGDFLAQADFNTPNPNPTFGGVSSVNIQSVYKVEASPPSPAVAATGGNFLAQVASIDDKSNVTLDSASAQLGTIRSRQNLSIYGGDPSADNLVGSAGEYRALGAANVDAAPTILQQTELASDSLYSISWAEVNKATPTATNQLPAGVYTVWDNGTLHYYDMSMADYKALMASDPNAPGVLRDNTTLPDTVRFSTQGNGNGLKAQIRIIDNTAVVGTSNTSELAIIPKKGVDGGPGVTVGGGGIENSSFQNALTGFTPALPTHYVIPNNGMSQGVGNLLQQVALATDGIPLGTGSWDIPGTAVINNMTGSTVNLDSMDTTAWSFLGPAVASFVTNNPTHPAVLEAVAFLGTSSWTSGGNVLGEIPGVTDNAKPSNIKVLFDPTGTSAVLSAPSNVLLGTKLEGDGASITAEGNLSLIGLGVDLSASLNPSEGVNLYTKKDLVMSTYNVADGKYNSVKLKGLVYAWGDIKGYLGNTGIAQANWAKFELNGAMVAYGKDPSDTSGAVTKGNIELVARAAKLKYDGAYLTSVTSALPPNPSFACVRWSQR